MVTRKQAIEILEKFKCNNPEMMAKRVQESERGLGFVLGYIYEHPNTYAISISEVMQISRARVGVILRKLEERGLIIKTSSSADARIETLSLTEKGIREVEFIKEKLINTVTTIIDKVGYDEINAFVETSIKIREVLEGNK